MNLHETKINAACTGDYLASRARSCKSPTSIGRANLSSLSLCLVAFATGLLIWPLPSARTATKNAKEIIENVRKKYDELKSLKADFRQDFEWELAGETQTVEGTFYLQQGNKYRIETDAQEIVTDGQTVWTFTKKNAQVIIDVLEDSKENPVPKNLLFKYSEEYEPVFVKEEQIDGNKTYLINLIPKEEEPFIKSMRIWVDASDWFTRKIEQVDINDNVNTYLVQNIIDDVELDPALFTFNILDDYEVVDMRSGQ